MWQDNFSFKIWRYENSSAWSIRTEVGDRQLSIDISAKTCSCSKGRKRAKDTLKHIRHCPFILEDWEATEVDEESSRADQWNSVLAWIGFNEWVRYFLPYKQNQKNLHFLLIHKYVSLLNPKWGNASLPWWMPITSQNTPDDEDLFLNHCDNHFFTHKKHQSPCFSRQPSTWVGLPHIPDCVRHIWQFLPANHTCVHCKVDVCMTHWTIVCTEHMY